MNRPAYLEEFTTRDAAVEFLESKAAELRTFYHPATRFRITLRVDTWLEEGGLVHLTMKPQTKGQKVGRMTITTEDHPSAASVRRLRKIVADTEEKP